MKVWGYAQRDKLVNTLIKINLLMVDKLLLILGIKIIIMIIIKSGGLISKGHPLGATGLA